MKVLVIHTKYKYKGGEDTVVAEEIKLMQLNGIEVQLLEFDNIKNSFGKLVQISFNIQSYLKTDQTLKAFQPDIVHVHNLHFGGSASVIYAIKKNKIPFVTTLHNYRLICPSGTLFHNGRLFLNSIKQKFPWEAIKKGVYKNSKLITFWVACSMYIHNKLGTYKLSNRYIVLSNHAKTIHLESTLGLVNEQIMVKPNFCSIAVLPKIEPQNHFLFIGRLTEEKGIRIILEVFASSSYTIKIAGDGPLLAEVLNYSSKYSNIEYLGIVSKTEISSLLQSCSALIFPSIWYEGMPLTIIEALASHTAVIASKLGAMETMIIDNFNGFHFSPHNNNDLIRCLDKWSNLTNNQKKEFRSNAYKSYLENYTPQKNFEQLLSIYHQAINSKFQSGL